MLYVNVLHYLTKDIYISVTVPVKVIADTNIFLAVALKETGKSKISDLPGGMN